MVQWLRFGAPVAGGVGWIPGQGPRSHLLKLRPGAAKYINKCYFFYRRRFKIV